MVSSASSSESEGSGTASEVDIARAYAEHGRFIANAIVGLTGPGPHVDELLQEVFIVAFKKRATFDGTSTLRTWVYGIASNLCLRHNRGARRFSLFRSRFAAEPTQALTESPERATLTRQRAALVYRTLAELDPAQREVFVLFELEALDGQQIAELLGLPLGTVWTRLRAARAAFEKRVRRHQAKEDAHG